MASVVFHQAIVTLQSHQHLHSSGFNQDYGNVTVKLSSKCPKVDFGLSLSRKPIYSSAKRNFCVVRPSASQTSVVDPVSTPSNRSTNEIKKKSSEVGLIRIRHDVSLWTKKNLFTCCADVPLTKKGAEEVIEAGLDC